MTSGPKGAQGVQRRLAAILSADVKGYSRLMGEDEVATVRTLTAHRSTMTELVREHRGRVVDSPGDNLLAEFSSVVDAVECAVVIQDSLRARNAELPASRRMDFRIGVNLGDVIVEGERIYGDGVNIAARVQELADGGGICLSGSAYDQVKSKLPQGVEPLGEHAVKNIADPVRVYRIALAEMPGRRATVTTAALELPDKPSIAILPFVNMSGDPEQEYFADGITEDLITALSNVYGLFVIARHSVFTYKGRAVQVQQVAREQGVRYVLEGSVRKAGDRVRITAQLIDASSARHLWAERYDRDIRDVFGVQDEITRRIVTELEVRLSEGEQARLRRRSTDSIEAYECMLRGRESLRRATRESNAVARDLFERAAALDPRFAYVHVLLGRTHWNDGHFGWSPSRAASMDRAVEGAARAIVLDDSLADAYALSAMVALARGEHPRAASEAEKAAGLNPNAADAIAWAAIALSQSGRPADGLELIRRAMRLCPVQPPYFYVCLGSAYQYLGRYDEAVGAYRRSIDLAPGNLAAHTPLAVLCGYLGREAEAKAAIRAALEQDPTWSIAKWAAAPPFDEAERAREVEALRRAGLP